VTNGLPTRRPVLVSDFDGTMTRLDFYQLARERLLPPNAPDWWGEYLAGRISHFEALHHIFASSAPGEAVLDGLTREMGLDPDLAGDLAALRAAGWEVVVVSAGCGWYIDRLLSRAGVALEVHANPGRVEEGRLWMEWPEGSPYFSPQTGIDKGKVVQTALDAGREVAFAGDGPPDLAPALLVPPGLRFARGFLADALTERGEAFHPFNRWSEVARTLCRESRA
jgi:2-hydroxy-3-keto-5-methylthiopentenyl-1-phosphate phosphatase